MTMDKQLLCLVMMKSYNPEIMLRSCGGLISVADRERGQKKEKKCGIGYQIASLIE